MPALYVANPTNQNQLISYRLTFNRHGEAEPERRFNPARQQTIGPGQQAVLGDRDFHAKQVTAIIDQLRPYGLVKYDEVGKLTRQQRATYVYREDLPVPADVMRRVVFHNRHVLTEEGQDRRQKAAVATNETVQAAVERSLLEKGITEQVPPDSTTVSFETVEQPDDLPSDSLAEGYDVVQEGKVGPHSGKPARPRKRARR